MMQFAHGCPVILVAKSDFRIGWANLLVVPDARPGVSTFSKISFGKYSIL